jgi:hypothetical protein
MWHDSENRRPTDREADQVADASAFAELADADSERRGEARENRERSEERITGGGELGHSNNQRLQACVYTRNHRIERRWRTDNIAAAEGASYREASGWHGFEPGLGRGSHGLRSWMDGIARKLEAQRWPAGRGTKQYDWEPPRVAAGAKDRAARLKMLGNACPPQQYLVALAAIVEMDRGCRPDGRG